MIVTLATSLSVLLSVAYPLLIAIYLRGWKRTPTVHLPDDHLPTLPVTVLVVARNESRTIGRCLRSLLEQDYPHDLLEIIVVDDFSTDDTVAIARSYSDDRVKVLELAKELSDRSVQSFKKAALTLGTQRSGHDVIATTDADCEVPRRWLQYLLYPMERGSANFVTGPVNFYPSSQPLIAFQCLDFTGTMLLTAAGIQEQWMYMANGANLAFTREVFYAVGGYRGNEHLASGDDIFLLQKVARQCPDRVRFCKQSEATVMTAAKASLSGFIQQRLRWATKNGSYRDKRILLALGTVFGLSGLILLNLFLSLWNPARFFPLFLLTLSTKTISDYIFLRKASRFFGQEQLLRQFWTAEVMHTLYIAGIGLLANIRKEYHWKGRKVR